MEAYSGTRILEKRFIYLILILIFYKMIAKFLKILIKLE